MIYVDGIIIDRDEHTIRHAGVTEKFQRSSGSATKGGPVRFDMLCHLILSGPLNKEVLFERLYGHRRDGGPELGASHIQVLFDHIKPVLGRLQLRLVKDRACTGSTRYCLKPNRLPETFNVQQTADRILAHVV